LSENTSEVQLLQIAQIFNPDPY